MTELFKKTIELHREDNKTNLTFPFSLPEGAEKLTVQFSYTPKILEDKEESKTQIKACLKKDGVPQKRYTEAEIESYLPIVNLVTISLDDPKGYRGCAHRHDAKQCHVFTNTKAPVGFVARPLEAGTWQLHFHMHAVVSEVCLAQVNITAEGAAL